MFLAATASLAGVEADIVALPKKLGLNATVEFVDDMKCTIHCRRVIITDHDNPTGIAPTHSHGHDHGHDHSHAHDHSHDHSHSHANTPSDDPYAEQVLQNRSLSVIKGLIDEADLSPSVKAAAKEMFQLVGEAESACHNMSIEEVHFHEVGAVDSILDIVGAALVIDALDFDRVVSDPVCTGYGFVMTAHGRLPVPAPATERILRGIPCYKGETESELVTPTGAAILQYLNPSFEPELLATTTSNYGCGTKDFPHPNALRVSLCEASGQGSAVADQVVLLQTNLDDAPGEQLGADFLERLLDEGARDAFLTPIIMKKGRPATKLEVICDLGKADHLEALLLEETCTIGVRRIPLTRSTLEREIITVTTDYGPIRMKRVTAPSGRMRSQPEYEDCLARSRELSVPLQEIYRAAQAAELSE